MNNGIKAAIATASLLVMGASDANIGMDPNNPTCPRYPNWSSNPKMDLTPVDRQGTKILLAEGVVDAGLPDRLRKMLTENPDISEIWLRSPGGLARAGNDAGRVIREADTAIITRIPKGWTCFSACNFVFMGGTARIVEPGGHFMVHMFTMTGDRDAINYSIEMGTDSTVGLISEVEQESALLATEDNDFLIRMGVSRKLLSEVMYKTRAVESGDGDKSTRRCLTQEESLRYNVANASG
ncbi:hypothetical protein [Parasphingorhabdus sp.]|uniref:COG3904 family protein n=1 Tax=Parasphingorhabdus sp. TaxID=2709688 RepID=UPI0032674741